MSTDNQDVSLRELPPSNARGPHRLRSHRDAGQDVSQSSLDRASSQQWEPRKRVLVLMGSAIAQLPIWGFAMNYGVFQEYYSSELGKTVSLRGNPSATGFIGTTSNGVMYLSMPLLFALFTTRPRLVNRRRTAALAGTALTCASFLASSFSSHVWHLIATQGVLAALGSALVYSPLTLSLGEWFNTRNRAVAYGVTLSCKNIVGSACPFLLRLLLDRYGFRATLRIWPAIAAGSSVLAIMLVPTHPSRLSPRDESRPRQLTFSFLKRYTFLVYAVAIALQSSGYGIPQTYLSTYAHDVAHLSQTTATLLLTTFNAPGIFASLFFGFLTDNRRFPLSATSTTSISAVSSAVSAFLFWGLSSPRSSSLSSLMVFSATFGFFAGGYSATWGGIVNELESEAAGRNEAIDTGLVYGLLNGARGLGYVSGGLVGVPLLHVGADTMAPPGKFGYGTSYGPLIVFTGLSSMFGGWGLLWSGLGRLT